MCELIDCVIWEVLALCGDWNVCVDKQRSEERRGGEERREGGRSRRSPYR
jgi:hypothetical protein